jgi:hypothetical protein
MQALFNTQNFEIEKGFDNNLSFGFFYANTGSSTRKIRDYRYNMSEQSFFLKHYFSGFNNSSGWIGQKLGIASANIIGEGGNQAILNMGTLSLSFISGYQANIQSFFINVFGSIGYAITNDFFGDMVIYGDELEETNILLGYGVQVGLYL